MELSSRTGKVMLKTISKIAIIRMSLTLAKWFSLGICWCFTLTQVTTMKGSSTMRNRAERR